MTEIILVQVTPVHYQAVSRCQRGDFEDDGIEARMKGINHTKQTGHTVAVTVNAIEMIEVKT